LWLEPGSDAYEYYNIILKKTSIRHLPFLRTINYDYDVGAPELAVSLHIAHMREEFHLIGWVKTSNMLM